jgi:hypothetical protein
MKRIVLVVFLVVFALWAARRFAAVRQRSVTRQHGTPDHWPAVARKPAA